MTSEKLSIEEFYTRAIKRLRTPERKGVHVVFSGLGNAAKAYYGAEFNQRKAIDELEKKGVIVGRPVAGKGGKPGGYVIYMPEDMPKSAVSVLSKILSEE